MHGVVFLGLLLSAAPAPAAKELPSAAVMGLAAKQGVHPDVAEQLSEAMVTSIRKTKRFSRVVSSGEMQSLISFEQQKQLAACEATSCMAEIAGSLGVDYLITGTLGRLGKTWLFNVRLINARTAVGAASVSRPVQGEDEGALISALDGIAAELLAALPTGTVAAPTPAPAPAPAPAPQPQAAPQPAPAPVAHAPTTPAESTASTPEKGSSPLPMVLRGVGVAGLALFALVVVGAVVCGVAAGSSVGVAFAAASTRLPYFGVARAPLNVAFWVGVALVALGAPTSLLSLVVGAGGLGSSFVVN